MGEDAVGPDQLQALDPQPLDPDRHRQPLAGAAGTGSPGPWPPTASSSQGPLVASVRPERMASAKAATERGSPRRSA